MSGNSGTEGAFDPARFQRSLDNFRDTIRDMEVVGFPKRDTELRELRRLIVKYPDEARGILDQQ
jgi:hypothetical protein